MSCVVVSPSYETVSIIECAFDQRGLKTTQLFCDVSSENSLFFSNTSDSSCAFAGGNKILMKAVARLTLTCTYEPRHDKSCLRGFPTRSNTNRALQPSKIASGLKFQH